MIAATCGGVRVVCVYAPNGRVVGSPFYAGQARLVRPPRALARRGRATPPSRWCSAATSTSRPTDADVWDPRACHGGTHVSPPEREAFARLCRWGLVDAYRLHHPEPGRYTWWDYRAGNFHKNFGMRIDHLLVDAAGRRAHGVGGDRPRGAQGQADPLRPRAAGDRPRPGRASVRRRLDVRRGPHRRAARRRG